MNPRIPVGRFMDSRPDRRHKPVTALFQIKIIRFLMLIKLRIDKESRLV